jgi:hypothetical protein
LITGAETKVDCKRALEALRNGVPSREAVSLLGCHQDEAEHLFLEKVDRIIDSPEEDITVAGLLVEGGFGAGKSHLLEYFEHLALNRNFVCSRVVISKETPLYDAAKMFRATIENGSVPDLRGQMIDEIAVKLQPNSTSYAKLFQWANQPDSGVSSIFPATLLLHERLNNDPELVQDIVRFWSGDKISIPRVRNGLRSIGQAQSYMLKAIPAHALAAERFKFALRLIRGAGYSGWAILIDEIELISRYSILQRGRAYAELARWTGQAAGEAYPGLVVAGAITDDFAAKCIVDGHDRDYVVPRLQAKGTDEFNIIAARAESGMRLIERGGVQIAHPDENTLESTYSKLKDIHSQAYGWTAPDVPSASRRISRPIRSHVRRWINEWDLRRLYPHANVQIEEQSIQQSYTEDKALEQSTKSELD